MRTARSPIAKPTLAVKNILNYGGPKVSYTAEIYARLFGWAVRWQGASIHGGHTVHMHTADQSIAL